MSGCLQALCDQFNGLPVWAKALIGTTTAVVTSYGLWSYNTQRKSPFKTEYKKGLVYLFQFPRCKYAPNASPFCLKLETWLRIAGVKYEVVPMPIALRSKEGTLPFVELDGQEYCDSGFAIRDLTKLLNKEMLDAQLSSEQKGVARAFEQMVDNSTVWAVGKTRYGDNFNEFMSADVVGPECAWFNKLPFFRWCVQGTFKKRMIAHGIGKHEDSEIYGIGCDDIQAIADVLGNKRYFLDEDAHRIDAALFGSLAQIIYCPIDSPLKTYIREKCPNLISYCDGIKEKFWPDWNEICEKLTLNTPFILDS